MPLQFILATKILFWILIHFFPLWWTEKSKWRLVTLGKTCPPTLICFMSTYTNVKLWFLGGNVTVHTEYCPETWFGKLKNKPIFFFLRNRNYRNYREKKQIKKIRNWSYSWNRPALTSNGAGSAWKGSKWRPPVPTCSLPSAAQWRSAAAPSGKSG